MRSRKNFAAAGLMTLLITGLLTNTAAAIPMQADEASARAVSTYAVALEYGHVGSFQGLCGMSVNSTLMVLGINNTYIVANGNQEWNIYSGKATSSGGYEIRTYNAREYTLKTALEAIDQSDNAVNLMVCFDRSPSLKGATYGHVFFIHAVIDGTVYYTESFATTWNGEKVPEGELIAVAIEDLCNYYIAYTFEGIVQFIDHTYDDDPILSERYPFTDIYESWQAESVAFCYENGLLSGETDSAFHPDGTMTRAMAVQALYNLEKMYGAPEAGAADTVERESAAVSGIAWNLDASAWYAEAMRNVLSQGIIPPAESIDFEPNAVITREALLSMLYQYCCSLGCPKADLAAGNLNSFSDADQISPAAREAFAWAIWSGVINGTDEGLLLPNAELTRAECAVILSRCAQAIARLAES
ncbi:MAG: S-layer homology domain-containing protein [Oscillospiraceae bacterium]|nr:S-layer homology domain-containing protein [Oscillospiraceae bacterium]